MTGLTLDTGALIALERRQASMRRVFVTAQAARARITVPSVVVAEWWRAGASRRFREALLRAVVVEDLTRRVAEIAGEALGHVARVPPDRGTIDGIVLASAWLRADVVYTSDVRDFQAIQASVPAFARVVIARA